MATNSDERPIAQIDATLLPDSASMLAAFAKKRLKEADRADARDWAAVNSQQTWQSFAAPRLKALRSSLGQLPAEPCATKVQITRTLAGDRFKIQNLVYDSRNGDPVSANLYLPDPVPAALPGILICHAHHNPKTHKELQDMGMSWARAGSYVLIPDMLGHGERRHHPFEGRQEYYFRYYLGMQLHLAGESLIGRFVWDLMRGVEVLLKQSNIDASKIILLGAVAGGGDPAAVAAALDSRITCVVPFNFGGPQPETPVFSNREAEDFSFTGLGGWESTRNLRLSARDGFLPWVITGGAIPRRLIYAHEFEWDARVDPVWSRYQKLYALHGAADNLSSLHGKGQVTQAADVATHCNQIGPPHLKQIYPTFKRWFGMNVPEEKIPERRLPAELQCLTDAVKRTPAHTQILEAARTRIEAVRAELSRMPAPSRLAFLRERYSRALQLPPPQAYQLRDCGREDSASRTILKRVLTTEADIAVPLIVIVPKQKKPVPVVAAIAQEGKKCFLQERAEAVEKLLAGGIAVCVPDLRGCGETDPDGDRSWFGKATEISSSELMLGRTQLGNRLHDLLAVQSFLATLPELNAAKLALWGDSSAAVNPPGFNDPPLRTQPAAAIGEPGAGLLVLLGGLFNPAVRVVFARRTLASWLSVLEMPFVHLPHDIIVPGIVDAGDIRDLTDALSHCKIAMSNLIDGRNMEIRSDNVEPTDWLIKGLA